jgi:hypothetical protein
MEDGHEQVKKVMYSVQPAVWGCPIGKVKLAREPRSCVCLVTHQCISHSLRHKSWYEWNCGLAGMNVDTF